MSGAPAYLGGEQNVPAGASGNNAIPEKEAVTRAAPKLKETANGPQGAVALVGGSKVVANTSVTANSRIQLTSQVDGGTPGWLRVSARTPGTSFTITSSSGTDTSTVAYQIFEPDA
jgi:hypothetical protein